MRHLPKFGVMEESHNEGSHMRRPLLILVVSLAVMAFASSAAQAAPPDGVPASCLGVLSSNEEPGDRAFVASVVFKALHQEVGLTGQQFYASVAQAHPGSLEACLALISE